MKHTIGKKIAALRKSRDITQAQLAEYLFLVPQTVSKWEAGNGSPDISLLPKIADFFGVSLDELFGRSGIDYAIDLVLKYSVLRDDNVFREASAALQTQLEAIDSALKLGLGDPAKLEKDKIELEACKMHLLLQQSRESANRALALAEDMSKKTGDMRFRLQRVQLLIEQGNRREVLSECESQFRAYPCPDTLRLYFEALLLLGQGDAIPKLLSSDLSVQALMQPPSPESVPLWLQYADAAAQAGNLDCVEACREAVLGCCTKEDRREFLFILASLYSKKGMHEKCRALKPQLTALLEELEPNAYFAARERQVIDSL